jgi:hypothetical protein
MKAIVRKRQRRRIVEAGKGELKFRVRGNEVSAEKIDRWMNRNHVPEDEVYSPSSIAGGLVIDSIKHQSCLQA